MSLNLPPSWPGMSPHAKACYLIDAHLAKNYTEARRKVGRMERKAPLVAAAKKIRLPYADS